MDCSNFRKDKVGVYALAHLEKFIYENLYLESTDYKVFREKIKEKKKKEKDKEKTKKNIKNLSFRQIEREFRNLLKF